MRKDWKYIAYIGVAICLFTIVKLMSPKQLNWYLSLDHQDKNPYGTFVMDQLLPGIFAEKKIEHSNKTIYELKDSLRQAENIIILSSGFSGDKPDTEALLHHVEAGGNVFIAASYYWGHFSDTLKISCYDYAFSGQGDILHQNDTAQLKFANASPDTIKRFSFRKNDIPNYFQRFDTTRTTVVARNSYNQPITIRMQWGKGSFILNCTPYAFTNMYLLSGNTHDFVSTTLSYLPERDVVWTEYYHLGRREASTPLRFILTNEPLAWAYYLTLAAIVLFMIFESKRKQRIIPVVKPLENTSLEFVSTIGNLYYQNGDHKNMAEKQINFLMEQIRTKYCMKTNEFNDEFVTQLASKSGNTREDVLALINSISYIQRSTMISAGQLMDLNNKIERFNKIN